MRRVLHTVLLSVIAAVYLSSGTGLLIQSRQMPVTGSGEHQLAPAAASQNTGATPTWVQRRHLTTRVAPGSPDVHCTLVLRPETAAEYMLTVSLHSDAGKETASPSLHRPTRAPPLA